MMFVTSAVALFACTPVTNAEATPGVTQRQTLPDDPGDVKRYLAARGLAIGINYVGEAFADASSVSPRRIAPEYRWEAVLNVDLHQLAEVSGTSMHAHSYLTGGRGLSSTVLGNQFAVSGIEAEAALQLFDVWVETTLSHERISIRAGRLAADDEFLISRTAAHFANATFEWPAIATASLSDGGPVYPRACLGVRFRYAQGDGRAVLIGVFDIRELAAAYAGPPAQPDAGRVAVLAEEQLWRATNAVTPDST